MRVGNVLVCTSMLFAFCAWVSHIYSKPNHAIAQAVTAATSVVYHSSKHPIARRIDMMWVHSYAVIAFLDAAFVQNWKTLACIVSVCFAYWGMRCGRNDMMHALFVHVPTTMGFIWIAYHPSSILD